jgi:hypothetical protein
MAPTPAGCPSLHELEGLCEYCGEICDSTQDELNAIACTYDGCATPTIYHQHCIETYLKSIRLDKYVSMVIFAFIPSSSSLFMVLQGVSAKMVLFPL